MKKFTKYFIATCLLSMFSISTLFAASTGDILDPGWTPGVTSKTPVYKLSSSSATAYGSNTGVTFSEIGYLEDNYATGERSFPIYLYEEDFSNADDKVKTYEIYFNYDYHSIAYIKLEATNIAGAIEANGDEQAELYLSGKMQKLSGDPNSATHLFKYNISLK